MVVEWIMTDSQYRDYTGKSSIRAVSVVELQGNEIASVSDYYDAYPLLSQVGMVPVLDAEQPMAGGDSLAR